jgi:hypothetical protein
VISEVIKIYLTRQDHITLMEKDMQ